MKSFRGPNCAINSHSYKLQCKHFFFTQKVCQSLKFTLQQVLLHQEDLFNTAFHEFLSSTRIITMPQTVHTIALYMCCAAFMAPRSQSFDCWIIYAFMHKFNFR